MRLDERHNYYQGMKQLLQKDTVEMTPTPVKKEDYFLTMKSLLAK